MTERTPVRRSRRQVLIAGGLAGGALAAGATFDPFLFSGLKTAERRGIAFGTVVSLKAAHANQRTLDAALDAAWQEIAAVEGAASLFRDNSAISKLNRDGFIISPPTTLVELVEAAIHIAKLTGGAFDPTVQPLWKLYDAAYKAGRTATPEELEAARAKIGWQDIAVSPARIALNKPGMALTLNGIAQGFATERCLKALAAHGIEDAFLNTGEIGIAGKREDRTAWTAAIADPRNANAYAALTHPASGILATSGDYATTWSADFSHHHIIDPTTLHSPPETASVSVLAQSGVLADGLATGFMIMGAAKSLALARTLPGVEALVITKSGARFATPGFPA